MRRPERPLRQQRTTPLHASGDRMYLGRFECFLQCERRKYRRQPLRHHRFSGARRPYEYDVMSAGRCYFESPLDTLLTFDIAEIQIEMGIFPEKFRTSIDHRRFQLDLPVQETNHLGDILYSIHIEMIDYRGLANIGFGNNQPLETLLPCFDSYGQRPLDRKNGAVERQLPHQHILAQFTRFYLLVACQNPHGQRQIIRRPFLAYIGRRHVHDYLFPRKSVTVMFHGRDNPLVALFHGGIGQSHHKETDTLRTVHLDSHYKSIDTLHGCAKNFHQHSNRFCSNRLWCY